MRADSSSPTSKATIARVESLQSTNKTWRNFIDNINPEKLRTEDNTDSISLLRDRQKGALKQVENSFALHRAEEAPLYREQLQLVTEALDKYESILISRKEKSGTLKKVPSLQFPQKDLPSTQFLKKRNSFTMLPDCTDVAPNNAFYRENIKRIHEPRLQKLHDTYPQVALSDVFDRKHSFTTNLANYYIQIKAVYDLDEKNEASLRKLHAIQDAIFSSYPSHAILPTLPPLPQALVISHPSISDISLPLSIPSSTSQDPTGKQFLENLIRQGKKHLLSKVSVFK